MKKTLLTAARLFALLVPYSVSERVASYALMVGNARSGSASKRAPVEAVKKAENERLATPFRIQV